MDIAKVAVQLPQADHLQRLLQVHLPLLQAEISLVVIKIIALMFQNLFALQHKEDHIHQAINVKKNVHHLRVQQVAPAALLVVHQVAQSQQALLLHHQLHLQLLLVDLAV